MSYEVGKMEGYIEMGGEFHPFLKEIMVETCLNNYHKLKSICRGKSQTKRTEKIISSLDTKMNKATSHRDWKHLPVYFFDANGESIEKGRVR